MYDPVCGMDNVTYSNECFLRTAECASRMVIQVANPLFFPTEKKVRHIGPCILGAVKPPRLNKDPRECDVVCPSVYKPVCGSDGA